MAPRSELQDLFEEVLGSSAVYFQPPVNVQVQHPCIVYKRDDTAVTFAGNAPYSQVRRYQVTVIDRDPDSPIPDKVASLPLAKFSRHFTAGNLNHDVFELYF